MERKTITLLVEENRTQFSPMGSLEVDISYILEEITPMALLKLILAFLVLKISNLPIWPPIQLSIPYLAFPSI
jgi:hypothetical protein